MGPLAGNVGFDGGEQAGFAELPQHDAAELGHVQRSGTKRDERFAPCLGEAIPVGPGNPLRERREARVSDARRVWAMFVFLFLAKEQAGERGT